MQPTKSSSRFCAFFGITAVIALACVLSYFLLLQKMVFLDRCIDAGGAYDPVLEICDKSVAEGERGQEADPIFTGTLNGETVRLRLDGSLGYSMATPALLIKGGVNTLRGYGKDENAVVYVLNPNDVADRQITLLLSKNAVGAKLTRIGADDKLVQTDVLVAVVP
jgi:hypothetical protein